MGRFDARAACRVLLFNLTRPATNSDQNVSYFEAF